MAYLHSLIRIPIRMPLVMLAVRIGIEIKLHTVQKVSHSSVSLVYSPDRNLYPNPPK